MKFTKLRIVGFKSFIEPTEFLIENGLTGVVGPNGCGKSNLVEAIKWVMGESSYKNMRASGMDDVIFSGSANRPARNTAEVGLVIDNSSRTAPANFNDNGTIEITRRIEREAGSIYRINGKETRARDVQLLFADASTGARSPSMVGQGRIGELIAAKPRQRRQILEEAAGISGLHSRRHEAELRLKAAEQNLDRLEDVLSQLASQLDSLKRQSRQAKRYRNLSGEIRKFEALLLYLRWLEVCHALNEAKKTFSGFISVLADATKAQANAAKNQAVYAHELPKLRENAAGKAASLQRIKHEQVDLDKEEAHTKNRLLELTNRKAQIESDAKREREILADNQTIFDRLSLEEEHLKSEEDNSANQREVAKDTLNITKTEQEESEKAYHTLTQELATLTARRRSTEKALSTVKHTFDRLEKQEKQASDDISKIENQLLNNLFIHKAQQDCEIAQKDHVEAEHTLSFCDTEITNARNREANARVSLNAVETELTTLETEARTLESILASGNAQKFTPLLDELKVKSGYETALGAALGGDLDVTTQEEADVFWAGTPENSNDPNLPEEAEPLLTFVTTPQKLKRRLKQTGLVEEDALLELAPLLKTGQLLVTRSGALFRWDGYQAKAGAETPSVLRLQQQNRLEDLQGLKENKAAQVNAHRDAYYKTQEFLNDTLKKEKLARENVRLTLGILTKSRENLSRMQNEESRLMERKRALTEKKKEILSSLSKAKDDFSDIHEKLSKLPENKELVEKLAKAQSILSTKRQQLSDARAVFDSLTNQASLRQNRLNTIQQERENWTQRAKAAMAHMENLEQRLSSCVAEEKNLADIPAHIARKRAQLFNQIDKAQEAHLIAQEELSIAEEKDKAAALAAKQALDTLSEIRESRARAEERLESVRQRKKDVARDISEKLDCAPDSLQSLAEIEETKNLPDAQMVDKRLDRLKNERQRLGGVNLRADTEMEEITQKRDELISERDDVIEAIKQLRQAIGNLNREGRDRLLLAFDDVNNHFKHLFTHLFGGGMAELQLTTSDDPLEAGLDIIARPPGKKPQTMTLLSGGEQALTALALIFAVFLTNPAPICVLDEVDAPLDDANVERFCNLLDEMARSTETRFLTITHNPITMARMNRLFGVTMAERGVSQLVSVDLQTAETYRETA